MHHYQWDIGDYRRDTIYLTHLEHGIYRSLIDSYYLQERPFTETDEEIMRKHRILSDEEKEAYFRIVADFFERKSCGYLVHNGCVKRLESIYKKSASAKKNAEKRWEEHIRRESAREKTDNQEGGDS